MGAWDVNAFGNDTACDWLYMLEEARDLSLVEETLDRVLNAGDEYIDASDAEEALVAIEVVARLQGNWGERSSYSELADAWVEQSDIKPSAALAKKAKQVIARILSDPSELKELWEESDEFTEWKDSVAELDSRVRL
ncbi:MAG TPA: DUF4259 domain-containing protein [Candidatus Hydrogenedentes bacterium]|nr:DUF4259 domain-containing protein [Candidatus Hydrogenedentota bacterium]